MPTDRILPAIGMRLLSVVIFALMNTAIKLAERHGIAFRLQEPQEPPTIIKAYADNFATFRKQPWTH